MNRTLLLKMYSIFYQALCYFLLMVNLIHMSKNYFSYDTDTSVGFYSPINITSPNVSICFDLNTIVGGYEPMMFYPRRAQYISLKDRFLFNKVPSVNKILKKCSHREAERDQFKYASNGSECLNIFNIKRYRMQSFMCYLFHVINKSTFNFNALSFSVNEPRLLYKLVIDAPLNAAGHTVVPLVHFDELADVDRMFMKEIFPSQNQDELYYLDYELFKIRRLPSPYTTNCGREPHIRCFYNCMARLYTPYGITPSEGISLEALATETSKVTDYSITTDMKMKNKLSSIDDSCSQKFCKSEACEQNLVLTHTSGPFANEAEKLSFILGSYKYPISKIIHSAKLSLMEYLTHCFSLAGIWVGFSVIACITRDNKLDIMKTYRSWQLIQSELTHKLPHALDRQTVRSHLADSRVRVSIKSRVRKIALVVFKLTVLLIFTVQAINQCVMYAKYQTVLYHDHIINPEFNSVLPSTVVCMDLDGIFFKQPPIITEDNFDRIWGSNVGLTVGQLLNATIGEEMLFKCRTIDYVFDHGIAPDSFKGIFQLKSSEECLKTFKFRKYYSNWQVCYAFKPFLSRLRLQWEFVFRETNPSKLYSLILNPKVKRLDKLNFVVFYPDDESFEPYTSSEYLAVVPKTGKKRVVMLSFLTEVHKSLPKPYDTKCRPSLSRKKCKEKCFKAGLVQFNLVPFQNTVVRKFDSSLLTYNYFKNITLYEHWVKLEHKCHESCLIKTCSYNFTKTYARNFPGKTELDVEVLVNTGAGPRIHSIFFPRFPFYDFYYQMFCLFTFWLNFSFVGLNFMSKKREKLVDANAKLLYFKSLKLLLKLVSVTRLRASVDFARKSCLNKSILKLICAIGMFLHLVIPFIEYFSYPAILLTTVSLEQPLGYKFSLCSDTQNLYEKGIIFATEEVNKHKADIFNKSIEDILDEARRSIKPDFLCGYWGLERDRNEPNNMTKMTDRIFFETDNSSLCGEMLPSRVSLSHGRTCFQFELLRKNDWTQTQVYNTLNGLKSILTVSINSSIISSRFTVLAERHNWFEPYHSSIWTPNVLKEPKDTRYLVSYVLYVVKPLPYPYSDRGFPPGHYTHCFYKCTNSKLQKFNFTRTHVGEKASKYKIVSSSLRRNLVASSLIAEIDRVCDRKCETNNSANDLMGYTLYFSISLISEPQPYSGPRKGFTRFDLRRTDEPVIEMKFLVAIFIYDLIINVGSIISIWFGLSVINIPYLVTRRSIEEIHRETLDNLRSAKSILNQINN